MKNKFFNLRLNDKTRSMLNFVADVYNIPASSVINMLIAKEARSLGFFNDPEGIILGEEDAAVDEDPDDELDVNLFMLKERELYYKQLLDL